MLDSTSEFIELDWPIFTDFQYFLQGLAPDMICNLEETPYCYSLTHECDYYLPLLIDMTLVLQIDDK